MALPSAPFRYRRLALCAGAPGGFRGALHTHTTLSDGRQTPDELLAAYARQGFHFVCITDHNRAGRHGGERHDGLLVLDGLEAVVRRGGAMLHVVALGLRDVGLGLTTTLHRLREMVPPRAGLLIGAHPHWSDLCPSALLGAGLHGVEIYNHDCQRATAKGYSLAHWDYALARGEDLLGFAVDDTHGHADLPTCGGGWVGVFAPRRTPGALFSALRSGRFYSSTGPQIYGLRVAGGRLAVRIAPATIAHLVGRNGYCVRRCLDPRAAHVGPSGRPELLVEMPLPSREDVERRWGYVRFECTDEATGRRAWTNALWPPARPR